MVLLPLPGTPGSRVNAMDTRRGGQRGGGGVVTTKARAKGANTKGSGRRIFPTPLGSNDQIEPIH